VSKPKPKVAILGAGLIGRMLTVSLMADYEVVLFDKDNGNAQQSAGYLAAAMLAPVAESVDCSAEVMAMGQKALSMWPTFLETLDKPVFFQQTGSLIVAFEQDIATLEQFERQLKSDDFKSVNPKELQQLEPELQKRFKNTLFLPNEAQLDNRQLLEALAFQIKRKGVAWHTDSIAEIVNDDVLINGQQLNGYDMVFDCRGIGLQADIQNHQASLRGVRGEVIRVHAPQVDLNRPVRLMHPRYPIYIAPKENHHFVIGATQIESEDNRKPTVRSALELLSACFSLHKGFAEAEIMSIDAGLRPTYLDNEPKIYHSQNRIVVNGLYRHGYLLAPVIVETCVALLKQQLEASCEKSATEFLPGLVKSVNPYTSDTSESV